MADPARLMDGRLTNGRGVGIRNTRERLQVLYGDQGKVSVANNGTWMRVELTFPANAQRMHGTLAANSRSV